jgi:sugar phosphate isomerase/epimerase
MRFGIMAMQIEALIPQGLPADQALAHAIGFDHAGLVRGLAQQGFPLIELGGDLAMLLPQTFTPPAVERLAALKAELGLSYTVHLPLWSVEPSSLHTPVREGSLKALADCVRAVQPLDPEAYVLHATGALAAEFYRMPIPELARPLLMRQFQAAARQSICQILAETGMASRKLAIETVEFPFDLTLELAEDLDTSICFDTGHVLVGFSGPVDVFDALERCLPRLGEIHLHDGPKFAGEPGYGKDHTPLGRGDLDVHRLLARLAQANFDGPIIFELNVEEALQSLQYIRRMAA